MNILEPGSLSAIEEIIVTPIAITDPPLLNAAGLHAPYALRTVLEVKTNQGIHGVSEIPGTAEVNEALQQVAQRLTGWDPFQLGALRKMIFDTFGAEEDNRGDAPWDQRKVVHIFSALEVACLDIIGKAVDRPVVDLLGGQMRDRVPFAAYLFYKYEGAGGNLAFNMDPSAAGWAAARQKAAVDPAGVVAQAQAMCAEFGFQSIKLKGGAFPPQEEVDAMLALRAAFGERIPLRHDPNAIWKPDTALEFGKKMAHVLEYWEDPVRGQKNMAELKKHFDIPFATNMCTTSFDDIPASVALHSEDIILSDHHFWGGLVASMQLAKMCETFGRDLSMHSNSHLGISLAAMVHLGAALPNFSYALDTHYPWQSEEIIKGGRMKFVDGAVLVPEGPGLGVELDHEALAKLHQSYLDCGLTKRDDLVEMRKVHPDWTFQATRW